MLAFKDLPVSWIALAQGVGFVSNSGFAYWVMNLLCVAVEVVMNCLQWINFTFVAYNVFVGMELLKVFLREPR